METHEVQVPSRTRDPCCDVSAVVEDSGQRWGQGPRREPVPALLAASCAARMAH